MNFNDEPKYRVGSIIKSDAQGDRLIIVENKEANIKNGRPGGDGRFVDSTDDENGVWFYDAQITVVTF